MLDHFDNPEMVTGESGVCSVGCAVVDGVKVLVDAPGVGVGGSAGVGS